MMNLNRLNTFLKVAELGSFTQAAKVLQQPKSRVSRYISQLESELRIDLIKRTTRSFSLTKEGEKLYRETQPLMSQLQFKFDHIAGSSQDQLQGHLSLTAPIDIGQNILPILIKEFTFRFPKIQIQLYLSDQYVDLAGMNIDIGIRVGNLKDSSLKAKKLAQSQLILVSSPEYLKLKKSIQDFEDLKQFCLISFYNENQIDPLTKIYRDYKIIPQYRINSFPTIKNMILNHMGIGILPNVLCTQEFREKKLVQVLPKWNNQKSSIQAIYSSSKNLSPKIRVFLDFLEEKKMAFR